MRDARAINLIFICRHGKLIGTNVLQQGRKASMEWKELKIYTTHEGVEPLTNALISFGIDGFVINDPEDIKTHHGII